MAIVAEISAATGRATNAPTGPASEPPANAVFFVVLVSALAQGSTAVPVITALGLATQPTTTDVIADALPIAGTGLDMIEVELPDDSQLVGQLLRETAPPSDVLVTAVIRNEQVLLPRGDTRLCPGDLLIMTSADRDHGIVRIETWARAQDSAANAGTADSTRYQPGSSHPTTP